MEPLPPGRVSEALSEPALAGWSVVGGKLHREFEFAGFAEAFAFMTRAAARMEEMDHHAEWLNVYNRVTVDLTTHDAGGITDRDVRLAREMGALA